MTTSMNNHIGMYLDNDSLIELAKGSADETPESFV
jgi:hypothetical protein